MKKIIAILLALAVVSMAFAQTVSISNKLETNPSITIDNGTHYWGFANNVFLRDEVNGTAQTADGRAKIKARIRFDVNTLDPSETAILGFKPRWSWNSAANNTDSDGNRSCVAAWLKPVDFLEIGIGNFTGVDADTGFGPNIDWSEWSTWYKWGFNPIPGLAGRWQRASSLVADGIQVVFTGVPNLKIGAGLTSARNEKNEQGAADKETMIKKGMFNGLSLGAGYDTDLFGVGAVWKGNFGMERGYLKEQNDKSYQDHTIYASFTFKGLQEAKIGTSIYAAVGFYTAKASELVDWSGYGFSNNAGTPVTNKAQVTSFLFDIGAGFNFRNGITDNLAVAVGYYKIGGVTSKVLPFCVRNTISYSASSDATFAFTLGYSQAGLKEKKNVKASSNLTSNNLITTGAQGTAAVATPGTLANSTWLIFAYPKFTWTMGAHSFDMGVKTMVDGEIVPHAKQGHEWAWTGLRGKTAEVIFPISWTYNF